MSVPRATYKNSRCYIKVYNCCAFYAKTWVTLKDIRVVSIRSKHGGFRAP